MTTETNELRVRPVTRFNLTRCTVSADGRGGAVRTLAELPTAEAAMVIATSLLSTLPNCTLKDEAGRDYPLRSPTGQHLMASRFDIDDFVTRKDAQVAPSEVFQVVGVIHHRSKVSYQLARLHLGDGPFETVDSDDLELAAAP